MRWLLTGLAQAIVSWYRRSCSMRGPSSSSCYEVDTAVSFPTNHAMHTNATFTVVPSNGPDVVSPKLTVFEGVCSLPHIRIDTISSLFKKIVLRGNDRRSTIYFLECYSIGDSSRGKEATYGIGNNDDVGVMIRCYRYRPLLLCRTCQELPNVIKAAPHGQLPG